jgi:hypothetical protein
VLSDKQIDAYSLQLVYPAHSHQRAHALDALVLHLAEANELPLDATEEEKDDYAMSFATKRVRPWAAGMR